MSIPDALAPLEALLLRHPDLEAQVLWASAGSWEAQDDQDEMMDGEEIPFYAEGLVEEGFGLAWQALGAEQPEVLVLFVWDQGTEPPAFPKEEGWDVQAEGRIAG